MRLFRRVTHPTDVAPDALPPAEAAAPLSSADLRATVAKAFEDEGAAAAERVIHEHTASLWTRLAELAEPTDIGLALDYARQAYALAGRREQAAHAARLAQRLGHLRLTETLMDAYPVNDDDLFATAEAHRRAVVRAKRRLLDDGYVLPPRTDMPAYRPIPRKVLYFLHNSLPYDTAGYATRSHGVLRGLRSAGIDVIACTRAGYPWDRSRRRRREHAVEHDRSYAEIDIVDGIRYRRLPASAGDWGAIPLDDYIRSCADQIVDLARIERPSIIHAASNHVIGLAAIAAARTLGVPSVYEVRGLWEITRVSREPAWLDSDEYRMFVRLETQAANECDTVIAITNGLKDELVHRGVQEGKIAIAPNSVDGNQFRTIPRDQELAERLAIGDACVVGYLGTFAQYEGLDDLLVVARRLIDRGLPIRLLLVGDGAEFERLRAKIVELRLENATILPGRVPFEEVPRYYSLIDVAAFPRKPLPVTEMVSPMKPFEAMAMGKAVLVSSVGALAEIVRDGETGLVFEKGNLDDMAAKLERLTGDPGLRMELGRRARQWVTTHRTWERTTATILASYRSVLPNQMLPLLDRDPGFDDASWECLAGESSHAWRRAALSYPWTGRTLAIGSEIGGVAGDLANEPETTIVALETASSAANRSRPLIPVKSGAVGVVGSALRLPFADATFDHVLVDHHDGRHPRRERVLSEAGRVLRGGGTLLLIMSAEDPEFRSVDAIFDRAGLTLCERFRAGNRDLFYLRHAITLS